MKLERQPPDPSPDPGSSGRPGAKPRPALLILPGGGAMGAHQCGAYQAIAARVQSGEIELAGIAGASIGALNGAVIARHLSDRDAGAGALESLWRDELAFLPRVFFPLATWYHHSWNSLLTMLLRGNPGLSVPNFMAWNPWGAAFRARAALHDPEAMERLIRRYVGSYGPNPGRLPLLLVRAVNAATQQPAIFHSWQEAVETRHLMASASIPFLYPLAEIDGEAYWDGDLLPYSPLRDLLQVLRSRPAEGRIGDYLVIIVDTICGERRRPSSALDLAFQVQAALLESRADTDEDYAEINNRYVDFLTAAAEAAGARPASALGKRIIREHAAALAANLCRLDVLRIRRQQALPFEYISRDLDYSPERLGRLMEQGYDQAERLLAEHVRS
ncbi:MAG TPA: patatin-like phospholipase family protein [Rhodocyclaceae bacterium]|nr:patatin-like phospholipase family protein [Rhodocyclaceae bacterium]